MNGDQIEPLRWWIFGRRKVDLGNLLVRKEYVITGRSEPVETVGRDYDLRLLRVIRALA